jgi:hypothetical protein
MAWPHANRANPMNEGITHRVSISSGTFDRRQSRQLVASVQPLDAVASRRREDRRCARTHTGDRVDAAGGGGGGNICTLIGFPPSHAHTWVGRYDPASAIHSASSSVGVVVWWRPRVADSFARCRSPTEHGLLARAYVCGSAWPGGVELGSRGGAGAPTEGTCRASLLLLILGPHVFVRHGDIFSQRTDRSHGHTTRANILLEQDAE